MPRILFIVPTDYDALVKKGVAGMILERSEEGLFQRVVTVHPAAARTRVIDLDPVHVLHEVGLDLYGPLARRRLFRALIAPLQLARVVSLCLRLVRSERIDLIRATDPFWCGLAALIVARLCGRPWCVSIHADYDHKLSHSGRGESHTLFGFSWPAGLVCRMVLSRAMLVLPIRESLRLWALEHGARPERLRLIPHGADSAELDGHAGHDVRARFGIPQSRRMVSFVGRLSPINYLDDVLQAARALSLRRDDFCLVIAGGGELEERLKGELDADPRLAALVRLVGFQPRGICFALRRQSAASLCLMGGFSLIEACLAGRPVISYDVDWHGELVQNGRTGFLLPEGDVHGVVRALERCLDDPSTALLGEKARELALSRHELGETSQTKSRCYQELLATLK